MVRSNWYNFPTYLPTCLPPYLLLVTSYSLYYSPILLLLLFLLLLLLLILLPLLLLRLLLIRLLLLLPLPLPSLLPPLSAGAHRRPSAHAAPLPRKRLHMPSGPCCRG